MTDKLPPNLLALFAPRPPLRWVPALDFPPEQRKTHTISAVAGYLPALAAYRDNDGFVPTESWLEMRDRKKREKQAQQEKLLTEGPLHYAPNDDQNIRGDPFKTLIVARLSYEANEHDLEKEFGRFGPIERIRIVTDTHAHEKPNKKKKPHRGYAFVVFEREKDMRAALDGCDGIRIKDRHIKVDVERGRTVKGWKPRRFGGGLGGRGYSKAAPPQPRGPGYGFGGRDGFRGGFQGGRGRGGFGSGGRDRGFRGSGGGGGGFGSGRDRGFGPQNGYNAPPNAPAGPNAGGRGGFGGDRDRDRNGPGGGYDSRNGSRSYDDRSGGHRDAGRFGDRDRRSGANFEPVRGGREHRDHDRSREDDTRKRGYEGGYEDPRKLRRY
ncbi:U1 small nuclear ribonucleoprotein of 70kDa MW N terminal-domain-containing protein [Durotheca rogersii]|uniref:U1 small nuclear ribonucleoprotein of 70kDa MW N terminal-domain-containing protein n=1 Tax=Durotheca rogersii TaxID=419775 RepID=UPI00221ECC71|nr:U1 small nuclear ribonucleoprotein of 70kDa MW N terminal-domain-containing protein [Durotheca rogersii]KAI5860517.1 U1 small nuclear ribonucleoprotein of 70kDa MW N terminal-domain-containing protein [Durotheca rogersii]